MIDAWKYHKNGLAKLKGNSRPTYSFGSICSNDHLIGTFIFHYFLSSPFFSVHGCLMDNYVVKLFFIHQKLTLPKLILRFFPNNRRTLTRILLILRIYFKETAIVFQKNIMSYSKKTIEPRDPRPSSGTWVPGWTRITISSVFSSIAPNRPQFRMRNRNMIKY